MMLLENKFDIGETVYLKTDIDQYERLVTGFRVRETSIVYYLSMETKETEHFHFEISRVRDVLKSLNINAEKDDHE
ncbi:hypothetical protein [Dyadobacter sp. CY312]|uniref:hypothetical protein n=1 Tax=Dyadobacter sp. CY312 TaxID=2907303 RepID=UPI001F3AB178|nr:hypothetical protein [Dyadobacter sp. CY312]MCE7039199.1 hypothetical protein [Dyadobacter sp. CY312]